MKIKDVVSAMRKIGYKYKKGDYLDAHRHNFRGRANYLNIYTNKISGSLSSIGHDYRSYPCDKFEDLTIDTTTRTLKYQTKAVSFQLDL